MLSDFIKKLIYGGGVVFDLAKWFILAVVLFLIVNTFFYAIFVVDGLSMFPSLQDREMIFWNKHVYSTANPQRGDVVVVNYPGDPKHRKYVKRIVGLPGDTIKIEAGKVYLNGKMLREKYLEFALETAPEGTWKIARNSYFVMGDNRPNSNDSRYFGPVEKRFVLGKSLAVIYPRLRSVGDI